MTVANAKLIAKAAGCGLCGIVGCGMCLVLITIVLALAILRGGL